MYVVLSGECEIRARPTQAASIPQQPPQALSAVLVGPKHRHGASDSDSDTDQEGDQSSASSLARPARSEAEHSASFWIHKYMQQVVWPAVQPHSGLALPALSVIGCSASCLLALHIHRLLCSTNTHLSYAYGKAGSCCCLIMGIVEVGHGLHPLGCLASVQCSYTQYPHFIHHPGLSMPATGCWFACNRDVTVFLLPYLRFNLCYKYVPVTEL